MGDTQSISRHSCDGTIAEAVAPVLSLGACAGLKLDICETYDHDTCLEHADKCTPCLAW